MILPIPQTPLQAVPDAAISLLVIVGTITTYMVAGMAWAMIGYKTNELKYGDEWDWDYVYSTLAIGGFAGLVILTTGGTINGESITAVAAVAIPMADKVYNTVDFLGNRVKEGGLNQADAIEAVALLMRELDDDELRRRLRELETHVDDDVDMGHVRQRAAELRRDPEGTVQETIGPIGDELGRTVSADAPLEADDELEPEPDTDEDAVEDDWRPIEQEIRQYIPESMFSPAESDDEVVDSDEADGEDDDANPTPESKDADQKNRETVVSEGG